jgi:hypothetical protein
MNLTNDEVLARLQAAFEAAAERTPIGDGRLDELTVARLGKDRRTLVAAFSAAAAVAVIAGTGVVLAGVGTDGSGSVGTASGGLPVPTVACTPQNYYVIASKQQLAGMTYLLSAPPPGYQMYGAWGTIDRSLCPDTTNWYVEYDKVVHNNDSSSTQLAIQLQVAGAKAPTGNGEALRGELGDLTPQPAPSVSAAMAAAASSAAAQLRSAEAAASQAASAAQAAASRAATTATASGPVSSPSALPSAVASLASPGPVEQGVGPYATWQTVTVDGHSGRFLGAKSGTGTLVWTDGSLLFQLNAPVVGGDSASIIKLAEQLVAVPPTDPRIKPPANCDVPAGAVCPDARG